ncbi:putative HTH-type transcriptional regulator YdeC [Paenibacillus sp. J23TS9]|uniref:AraC family transcriptional regulator n=1 Tax=Paenibacillus sp. J23TS9 TaxID=2807193 RepID=UPI001B1CAA06|nr:AraC family transcriptional regulator [Paenibacillus sp. J23TS9]GIP27500.1 putative HTH-type transcriptional regulator YdeC [Paenibacillus sp. J23TS9]
MNREMLREDRVHGHPMYPVSIYPNIEQRNGNSILDCHWHDEMEFIVIRKGHAVFQLDMTYVEAHEGQAIFVNSGQLHAGVLDGNSPCVFSAVVFSPDLLTSPDFDVIQEKYIGPLLDKSFQPEPLIKGERIWEKEVLAALNRILEDNEQRLPAYELSTKAHLYLIFARMFIHPQNSDHRQHLPSGSPDKVERLKTVLNFIHDHYSEPLRLKDLAGLISMSEGHFCRFFKQLTQKSPVEYINHYRILKACKLLENSGMKIVDIAMESGFDNLSYFITVFKQMKGCTPSRYRKPFNEKVAVILTEPAPFDEKD